MSRSEISSWRTRGDSLEAYELVLQSLPVSCRQSRKTSVSGLQPEPIPTKYNVQNVGTEKNVDTHLFLPIEKVGVHVFIAARI